MAVPTFEVAVVTVAMAVAMAAADIATIVIAIATIAVVRSHFGSSNFGSRQPRLSLRNAVSFEAVCGSCENKKAQWGKTIRRGKGQDNKPKTTKTTKKKE